MKILSHTFDIQRVLVTREQFEHASVDYEILKILSHTFDIERIVARIIFLREHFLTCGRKFPACENFEF